MILGSISCGLPQQFNFCPLAKGKGGETNLVICSQHFFSSGKILTLEVTEALKALFRCSAKVKGANPFC